MKMLCEGMGGDKDTRALMAVAGLEGYPFV